MDRGAWQATAYRVARVRHDLATKPPSPPSKRVMSFLIIFKEMTNIFDAAITFYPNEN